MAKYNDPRLTKLAAKIYEETKSGNAVAERLDVSHSTAYRLLRNAGIELPDRLSPEVHARKKKLHGQSAADCAADYAAGMSAVDLQKKYGVSMWAIRTAAQDAGVTMRNRGGRYRNFSEADVQEAVSLYESGWSQAQIAAKFNAHQVMVSRLLQKAGVAVRRQHARGPGHGSWKGGESVTKHGYVTSWVDRDDPLVGMADSQGRILAHRLAMARALGRPLHEHESVHHINGDRKDNRISNLQLRFGKHGKGVAMVCAKCGSHEITYRKLDD